jgi:hypothetical protein
MSMEHLEALRLRLSHEKVRLAKAKTGREKEFHSVRVKQCEKEIAGELVFLGIKEDVLPEMTDDQLLAEIDKS